MQGETVQYTVGLQGGNPALPFGVQTGDLPLSVEKGFVELAATGTLPSQVSLVLKTKDDAQTGSLGVIIFYYENEGEILHEATCQLNIIIGKRAVSNTVSGATAALLRTPSPDALQTIPENLISVVGAIEQAKMYSPSLSTPKMQFTTLLKRGNKGIVVAKLQEKLQKLGFFPATVERTDYFGAITQAAVRAFQKERGLEAVGFVGPKTRAILNNL